MHVSDDGDKENDGDAGGDTLLFSGAVRVSHGVLILHAEESDSGHEDWDPREGPLNFERDSLYISVTHAVEGPTRVEVFDGPIVPRADLDVVFDQEFACAPEDLCITDPSGDIFVRLNSVADDTRVRVYVDNRRMATEVLITIGDSVDSLY